MKGITKLSILLVCVFMVSLLAYTTLADVWWVEPASMVINQTSHFDAGTHLNTYSTDDTLYLKNITYAVNSSALNSLWYQSVNSVAWKFQDNMAWVDMAADTADAAIITMKLPSDFNTTAWNYTVKANFTNMEAASSAIFIGLLQNSTAPVTTINTDWNGLARGYFNQLAADGGFRMTYKNEANVQYYWDGNAWTTTVSLAYDGVVGTTYITTMESNSTHRRYILEDASGSLIEASDWVVWTTNYYDVNAPFWIYTGESYTSHYYSDIGINYIAFENATYKTSGNWTSATQTMSASSRLSNLTVNFTGFDQDHYIDKITVFNESGDELDDTYLRDSDSLVSYYKFENNGIDELGLNSAQEPVNATYTTDGKFGGAYDFDGIKQTVNISDSDSLDISDLTLSAWVYADSTTTKYMIFKGEDTNSQMSYGMYLSGTSIAFVLTTNGVTIQTLSSSAGIVGTGQWYHIVTTYEEGVGVKYYVNGVYDSTNSAETGALFKGTGRLTIGARWDSSSGSSTFNFDGIIDDVAIFNKSLSAGEVADLYSGTHAKYVGGLAFNSTLLTDANLVSLYQFENNADDFKGLNSGTVNGATATSSGKYGGGYSFVQDDYIQITDSASLDLSDALTVSLWMKPNNSFDEGDTARLVHKNSAWSIHGYGANTIRFYNYGDSSSGTSTAVVTNNEWQHIVVTKSGTAVHFYRNGVLADSDTTVGSAIPNSAVDVFIGIDEDLLTGSYNGTLDDIAIFNRYMTADEVLQLYKSTNKQTTLFINNSYLTGNLTEVNDDFKVRFWLKGNGTSTPVINDIIGYYETTGGGTPSFYQCYYDNSTGVNITNGITVALGENLRCNDTSVFMDIDTYIENYGNFTLDNFNLTFSGTGEGSASIYTEGPLVINNTNITSSAYHYLIGGYDTSMVINYSTISEVGWGDNDWERGVEIMGNGQLNITNSTIENSFIGATTQTEWNYIINSTFSNNANNGINLLVGSNNTILGNTFYKNNYDVYVNSESNLIENNSMVSGTDSQGFYLERASKWNNIINNTFTSTKNSAIGIQADGSNYNNITNNTFYNIPTFGIGIRIDNSDYNNITGNEFFETIKNGMIIDTGSEFNIIGNNTILNIGSNGISLDGPNNTIEYNYINYTGSGIYLDEGESNLIQYNQIDYSTTNAITVKGLSNHTTIFNNTGYANTFYGIAVDGTAGTFGHINVSYNTMSYTTTPVDGIGIWIHAVWDSTIEYNVAEWNNGENIRCHDGGYHTVRYNNVSNSPIGFWNDWSVDNIYVNNTIYNSTTSGFESNNIAEYVIIANNTFNVNYDSIYLLTDIYPTINNNIINGSSHDGITFETSTFGNIYNNTISNSSGDGIYLTGSDNNTINNNNFNQSVAFDIFVANSESILIENNSFLEGSDCNANIHLESDSPFNIINNNTGYNSDATGEFVTFGSDSNIISNNTIMESWIGIFGTATDDNVITGNQFNSGSEIAIDISSGSNNYIGYNNIQHVEDACIYLPSETSDTVEYNNCSYAPNEGIMMQTSDSMIIRFNNINHTGSYGIYNEEGNLNVFTNNTHYNNSVTYYSDLMLDTDKNTIYNMTSNLTYFDGIENNIEIKELFDTTVPANTSELLKLDHSYLNITNNTLTSWIYLNLTYDESQTINENRTRLFRYNGTNWTFVGGTVNNILNYVYHNITSFSPFALFEDSDSPPYWSVTTFPLDQIFVAATETGTAQFNATWTDNALVSEVIFEFDGVNKSYLNGELIKNGNDYYTAISGMAIGLHHYKWYANDSSNNWNVTSNYTYAVSVIPASAPGTGGGGTIPSVAVCGNGICETGENYLLCPQDCKIPNITVTPISLNWTIYLDDPNTHLTGSFNIKITDEQNMDLTILRTPITNDQLYLLYSISSEVKANDTDVNIIIDVPNEYVVKNGLYQSYIELKPKYVNLESKKVYLLIDIKEETPIDVKIERFVKEKIVWIAILIIIIFILAAFWIIFLLKRKKDDEDEDKVVTTYKD